MIEFYVLGVPAPKGSSRAFINKKTGRAFVAPGGAKTTEVKLKSWDTSVRECAREALVSGPGLAGPCFVGKPLAVQIEFLMLRPSGHWKPSGGLKPSAPIAPATKPDIDKLARSTLDSLTGLVFDDDSRIVSLLLSKAYAAPGQAGARIVVQEYSRDIVISFQQSPIGEDDDDAPPAPTPPQRRLRSV